MALALNGIRVLELTDSISGPFAGMSLARCGAEVIRVESLRHLGFREPMTRPKTKGSVFQPPERIRDLTEAESCMLTNTNFTRYNLGKLSVALNLTLPEGRALFMKLVGVSDVVLDNLSFGVTQKWGFDYDSLSKVKPNIILASMPSLGQGPHEQWTTWGMNLLSFTGISYSWGHPDTPVEERAANSTYGDYIAAMKTAATIMAALYYRTKTGEGQHVEISQAESTASMLGVSYLDYFVNDRVAKAAGNRHPLLAPYNCYKCKGEDAWCVIAVTCDQEWQQFCNALDFPAWVEETKFRTMASRVENVGELDAHVRNWTGQRTSHQVMKILQSVGVPAGAVQNSEDLYYDLQLRARGHMVQLGAGLHADVTFDGPPITLSAGQARRAKRAPMLGEHNRYVYGKLLGLPAEEIEALHDRKVIF
jgi:crotonobetainyl-CoA:carnitine CoA-transferase CaiB-like acyl-CoA transferase